MKIVKSQLPILDRILKAGLKPQKDTIFTIGNIIYNPSGLDIPDDIMIHEEVHSRQQEGKDDWIDRYLTDSDFRIEMEAEAFAAQYDYSCKFIKDRNERVKMLDGLAKNLSSEIYGNAVSKQKAFDLIKKYVLCKN